MSEEVNRQQINTVIQALKQWTAVKAWEEAAGKVDEVIKQWETFASKRQESVSEGCESYLLKLTKDHTELVSMVEALREREPKKLQAAAATHFEKICNTLAEINPYPNRAAYEEWTVEKIAQELKHAEQSLQPSSGEGATSRPSPTQVETFPGEPPAPDEKFGPTTEWTAPEIEQRGKQRGALLRWVDRKEWQETFGDLEKSMERWLQALEGLQSAKAEQELDVGELKLCADDILRVLSPIKKGVDEEFVKASQKTNTKFDIAEDSPKSFINGTRKAVKDALECSKKGLPFYSPEGHEKLSQEDGDRMKPKKLFFPEDSTKKSPTQKPSSSSSSFTRGQLFFALCLVIGVGWIVWAQRGTISKGMSRWLRGI